RRNSRRKSSTRRRKFGCSPRHPELACNYPGATLVANTRCARGEDGVDVLSNLNESAVLSVLRTFMPSARPKPSHQLLAAPLTCQGNACGGWVSQPRSTQIQLPVPMVATPGAYGIGTSVSTVQGIVADAAAPAGAQPSGVPPRGRPV